ncbi:MAG: TIM barrel protein [Rhodospirillales bacterium]
MSFRFSANTGFLFKDRPFMDRIRAAKAAGFDALEFHDEARGEDPAALADLLAEAGLPVCGMNVRMEGKPGCAAIPGQEDQFRKDIGEAAEIAGRIDAGAIHVLAGKAEGAAARAVYIRNLADALEATDRVILIEPLCDAAMPGYFLRTVTQAAEVIAEVGHPRLKIMFDCFHVGMEQGAGAVADLFRKHAAIIGHVQIASVPDRVEPLSGELQYPILLPVFQEAGYHGAFGCEYRQAGIDQDAGLARLRQSLM